MRVLRLLGPAVCGLVAFGIACGGDAGGPNVSPQALVRVAGDSQGALSGSALVTPLTVRVMGSDGQPYKQGVTVTWAVTGGAATLGTPTVTSDTQGLAHTTVTLGASPGAIGVQASVASVTPVTFTATACDHPTLALDDTVNVSLAVTDCRFSGFYTDFFELSVLAAPQGVILTETSGVFDTWLELYQRSGNFLAYDDDIDSTNQNSRLTAILATGDYLIAPSSYATQQTGNYTLSALSRPASLSACDLVWVTRGVVVSDSVTPTDCVDSTGGLHYADVVALYLVQGTVLKVTNKSSAFDAALFLHTGAGASVASNNDSSAATTDAFILYNVAQTGAYLLFAGTNDSAGTGAYTLNISASTSLNSAGGEAGPQILRMGGLRMPKALRQRGWRD